jgi:hypothetical protein
MDNFPSVNELIEMAKNNPELLDELQKKESQKIIDNASSENKSKLEGIQFKVDMIKRKNKKNLTKTNLELSDMLWESFHSMNNELQAFREVQENSKKPNLKIVKKED